jgi:hypothetical protein
LLDVSSCGSLTAASWGPRTSVSHAASGVWASTSSQEMPGMSVSLHAKMSFVVLEEVDKLTFPLGGEAGPNHGSLGRVLSINPGGRAIPTALKVSGVEGMAGSAEEACVSGHNSFRSAMTTVAAASSMLFYS